MKSIIALSALLLLMLTSPMAIAASQYYPPDTLSAVIQGPQRSVAHKLRDKYRHPHQTLEFFGIQPDMTVVELFPGGGWYTEILAPYLKAQGQLIEAVPPLDSKSDFLRRMTKQFRAKLKASPQIYAKIKLIPFAPPQQVTLGPANSADMVLTFRNLHDWKNAGTLKTILKAVYTVLKPGGIFGVVDHRANPDTNPTHDAKELHRIPEAYVINAVQQAGFKLDATSRINANPADPRTMRIFVLPPTRAASKKLQPIFDHIGESDRMTLRFIKPQ